MTEINDPFDENDKRKLYILIKIRKTMGHEKEEEGWYDYKWMNKINQKFKNIKKKIIINVCYVINDIFDWYVTIKTR